MDNQSKASVKSTKTHSKWNFIEKAYNILFFNLRRLVEVDPPLKPVFSMKNVILHMEENPFIIKNS